MGCNSSKETPNTADKANTKSEDQLKKVKLSNDSSDVSIKLNTKTKTDQKVNSPFKFI